MPTDIDHSAPVIARASIAIAATRATVWALHTDVNSWASWNADISEARLDGPFEVGSSFEWTSYNFPVTSVVYAVEEQHRILWGAPASGITGIHEWLFEDTEDGVTVATTESFAGAPVEADVTAMQATLDQSLQSWLAQIKGAAERT
ncbi:SRPBCC family protein [Agreia sp.]|uniref:SRPBCC family protein n=1 Tax=Agreia sp. TaxID=1872416 RepID=UPI0035BC6D39